MEHRGIGHHQRGSSSHNHASSQLNQKRNYKLIVDPAISKGTTKIYRFEGVVDGDPTAPNLVLRDPRKPKLWITPEPTDLPIPRFKIDSDYVGTPPPLEVTIFNINDNINKQFLLNEIVHKHQCGALEDLHIFTHKYSRKHLGVATVMFEEPESARNCVRNLHNFTLMGKALQVFLDPFGKKCKRRVDEIAQNLEEEAKREEEAKEARKRPPLPPKPHPPDDEDKPPPPLITTPSRERTNSESHDHHMPRVENEHFRQEKEPFRAENDHFRADSEHYRSENKHYRTETEPYRQEADHYRPDSEHYRSESERKPYQHASNNSSSHPSANSHYFNSSADYSKMTQANTNNDFHNYHYQNYPQYHNYPSGYPPPVQNNSWQSGMGPYQPLHGQGPRHPVPRHQQGMSIPGQRPLHPGQAPPPHSGQRFPHPGQANMWPAQPMQPLPERGLNPSSWDGSFRNCLSYQNNKYEKSKSNTKALEVEEEEGNDEGRGDLDARIALLLENKDSSIAPSFLNLGLGSEDEDDDKKDNIEINKVVKSELDKTEGSGTSPDSSSDESISSSSSIDSQGSSKTKQQSNDKEPPLSTPPSPFLSDEIYLYWYDKGLELKKEAQQLEQQENRERLKKLKKDKSKKLKEEEKLDVSDQINGVEDDRMSLSSLSSTDNPILQQDDNALSNSTSTNHFNVPPHPHSSFNNPPSSYNNPPSYPPSNFPVPTYAPPSGYNPIQQQPSDPYNQNYPWGRPPPGYPTHAVPYPNYDNSFMAGYNNQGGAPSYPPMNNTSGVPYPPMYGQPYPPIVDNSLVSHISGEYHDPTINSVLDKVIEELKIILKKDFNKKMIEATAFKSFEKWWDDQESSYKLSQAKATPGVALPIQPHIEKVKNISSLFESKDTNFGLDSFSSISLGFRAAMPKMPSFKKVHKIKPATPPRADDEDSQGLPASGDDSRQQTSRVESSSDSGLDDDDVSPTKTKKRVVKKPQDTWSSDESEASESSSKEDSSDSEEESSDDESSFTSSDSEEELQQLSKDAVIDEIEETPEERELRNEEEEFNKFLLNTVDYVMKTPERDSRTITPVPDVEPLNDSWLNDEEPKSTEDSQLSKIKESTSLETTEKIEIDDKSSPQKQIISIASYLKDLQSDPKPSIKEKVIEKEAPIPVPQVEPSSETDTAEENDEEEGGTSVEAAKALIALSGHRESTEEPQRSPVLMEHSYCLPWSPKESRKAEQSPIKITNSDHVYTKLTTPPTSDKSFSSPKPRGKENRGIPAKKTDTETSSLIEKQKSKTDTPVKSKVLTTSSSYKVRSQMDEYNVLYSFLMKGIDQEDIELLKRSYEKMLIGEASKHYWLNDTHWVDHVPTDIPPPPRKKRKVDELPLHKTGCARTEGIYKVDLRQKQKHKFTFHNDAHNHFPEPQQQSLAVLESSKAKMTQVAVSREVRSFQRRLLTAFGNETDSDLLKFNQLKFRKKLLKFGKSKIHDWGLFAMEAIAADEMVIEYVGQSIRPIIADLREINYEKMGIGSSYLFRVDVDSIIDATKCGNLARFINHSCNPNCYAKIVSMENQKKIVIYSKQAISCGEEIVYDYKFPIEDQKIVCLCGGSQCRGTLN